MMNLYFQNCDPSVIRFLLIDRALFPFPKPNLQKPTVNSYEKNS